jgi:hypothetical protein
MKWHNLIISLKSREIGLHLFSFSLQFLVQGLDFRQLVSQTVDLLVLPFPECPLR